ncbi:hypothetical protein F4802DRAFT_619954 [Xylaria palmicola]|nr:hypothetical protein F4802DRAFT_619954 [Xylaria palmicola]
MPKVDRHRWQVEEWAKVRCRDAIAVIVAVTLGAVSCARHRIDPEDQSILGEVEPVVHTVGRDAADCGSAGVGHIGLKLSESVTDVPWQERAMHNTPSVVSRRRTSCPYQQAPEGEKALKDGGGTVDVFGKLGVDLQHGDDDLGLRDRARVYRWVDGAIR